MAKEHLEEASKEHVKEASAFVSPPADSNNAQTRNESAQSTSTTTTGDRKIAEVLEEQVEETSDEHVEEASTFLGTVDDEGVNHVELLLKSRIGSWYHDSPEYVELVSKLEK